MRFLLDYSIVVCVPLPFTIGLFPSLNPLALLRQEQVPSLYIVL